MLSTAVVFADESTNNDSSGAPNQQKDVCMLAARHCGLSAMSLQDKIEKLKDDIDKGRAVYTPKELDRLQKKLDEVNETLDFLIDK